MSDACTCPCHGFPGTVRHMVACCKRCPGCGEKVFAPAFPEHSRRCVAVQARPLVEAAVRVAAASTPIFHADHFAEVVWEAFQVRERPGEAWTLDVLSKLPYATPLKHGFYRYEA